MTIKNVTITNKRNFKVDGRLDAVSIEATFEYRNRQYAIKFIDAGFKTQVLEVRNTEGRKVNFVGATVDVIVEVVLVQMAAEVVESEVTKVEGETVVTEVSVADKETEMYKVNSKISESVEAIKKALTSDEMLFRFDVVNAGNAMLLVIQKESVQAEYRTYGTNKYKKMERFLNTLKEAIPLPHRDDIDFILEEMAESFHYASGY